MSEPESRNPFEQEPAPAPRGGMLRATPGIVRIAASASWHTAGFTVAATFRAYRRMARAAVSGESPTQFFEETADDVREYARRVLGVIEGEGIYEPESDASPPRDLSEDARLRARGAELLRNSADVRFEEDAHPAYERMLEEIAPDEGRVLRLLALEGSQPSVDVRSGGFFGVGSQLVEPGLTMIGAEAGCRYPDRVHSYLNNLFRLGLIWFSREPVKDPLRYQVLEAQPEAAEAMREASRPSTVRRSIGLTPFGEDFCAQCLPLGEVESDSGADAEMQDAEAASDAEFA